MFQKRVGDEKRKGGLIHLSALWVNILNVPKTSNKVSRDILLYIANVYLYLNFLQKDLNLTNI